LAAHRRLAPLGRIEFKNEEESMNIFWSAISGLGAILTILVWAKDNLKDKPKRLLYPTLIVVLSVLSTYQFEQNKKFVAIRSEASSLINSWPKVESLKFRSKGERMGIILGALGFLEKHKSEFPETYKQATSIVKDRLSGFNSPKTTDDSYKEYELLEDGAGAMIQLVSTLAR